MWKEVWFFGAPIMAWVCPNGIENEIWKRGSLKEGQVWAQISEDGPYRPCYIVKNGFPVAIASKPPVTGESNYAQNVYC